MKNRSPQQTSTHSTASTVAPKATGQPTKTAATAQTISERTGAAMSAKRMRTFNGCANC